MSGIIGELTMDKLTKFEIGMKRIIEEYFLDDNHTDEKLFHAIRQIMPPTCTPNQRKFLDIIERDGMLDGDDNLRIPDAFNESWGATEINAKDFPDVNLSELVEGEE